MRQRALNYLSRREHSRQELQRKLLPYVEEGEDVDALMADFQKRGWLSDERFAEQVVHARKNRYGSLKVAHELREKGVSESLTDKAIAAMMPDELANASAIWRKKFGMVPTSREEWAKQARFLQSRGFGFEIIKRILNDTPEE